MYPWVLFFSIFQLCEKAPPEIPISLNSVKSVLKGSLRCLPSVFWRYWGKGTFVKVSRGTVFKTKTKWKPLLGGLSVAQGGRGEGVCMCKYVYVRVSMSIVGGGVLDG